MVSCAEMCCCGQLTLDVESNKVGPDGVRELSHVLANLNDTLTAINLQVHLAAPSCVLTVHSMD